MVSQWFTGSAYLLQNLLDTHSPTHPSGGGEGEVEVDCVISKKSLCNGCSSLNHLGILPNIGILNVNKHLIPTVDLDLDLQWFLLCDFFSLH